MKNQVVKARFEKIYFLCFKTVFEQQSCKKMSNKFKLNLKTNKNIEGTKKRINGRKEHKETITKQREEKLSKIEKQKDRNNT